MKKRLPKTQYRDFNMIKNNSFQTRSELLETESYDYSKMRVGLRTVEDATINLGSFSQVKKNYSDKAHILNAINQKNYNEVRDISHFYYETSGIYQRVCKYLAFLYKYDWFVTTYVKQDKKVNEDKILKDYSNFLIYLENSDIKRLFGNIALEVVKTGVYYGIKIDNGTYFTLQQLPAKYCRSRFNHGTLPAVEMNMKFFDDYFKDIAYRMKILSVFPKDVQKGYVLYREKKLKKEYTGDEDGWYLLEPGSCFKFNLNGADFPPLVEAIPSIIDLDLAQELDRKKTMQQLLKIVIQKLPIDKNGDLIFDIDEARDIHNNSVAMLKKAVGLDVLTTFADVEVADLQDKNVSSTSDGLMKVERTVYNNLGIAQNLFNTEGNMALEKSVFNDEATMRDLILQFQALLNHIAKDYDKTGYNFRVQILETTIYNYKDLSKLYKEHMQLGHSRMLSLVALGHSQSSILANAYFENNILKLSDIMIPPMSSSTMSSSAVKDAKNKSENKNVGRPEKPDEQKSEKTIQNKESMS